MDENMRDMDAGIDSIHLTELQPAVVRPGCGQLFINRTPSAGRLAVGDDEFRRGICIQGSSDLIYTFQRGRFARFKTYVGIEKHAGPGTAKFQIYVDHELKFSSFRLSAQDQPQFVLLFINHAAELKLVTDCDQAELLAVWGLPQLSGSAASEPGNQLLCRVPAQ